MRLTYLALTHDLFPLYLFIHSIFYLFIFDFKEKPVATRVGSSSLETCNFQSKSKEAYCQCEYAITASLCCAVCDAMEIVVDGMLISKLHVMKLCYGSLCATSC